MIICTSDPRQKKIVILKYNKKVQHIVIHRQNVSTGKGSSELVHIHSLQWVLCRPSFSLSLFEFSFFLLFAEVGQQPGK